MSVDRRRQIRHRAYTPAYASIAGTTGGVVLNANEHGVAVQTLSPPPVQSIVDIRLDLLDTRNSIASPARVAWSDGESRSGLELLGVTAESRRQLQQWLLVNALAAVEQGTSTADPLSLSAANKSAASSAPQADVPPAEPRTPAAARIRQSQLDSAARQAIAATHADGSAIALAEGEAMICQATAGAIAPPIGSSLDARSGLSGACVTTGKLLRCDDPESDSRVDRESCAALGIKSVVAVPIFERENVIGILEVFSRNAYAFDERHCAALESLAQWIGRPQPPRSNPKPPPPPRLTVAVGGVTPTVPQVSEEEDSSAAPDAHTEHKLRLRAAYPFLLALALVVAAAVWFTLANLRMTKMAAAEPSRQLTAASSPASRTASAANPEADPNFRDASNLELRRRAEQGEASAQFVLGAKYAAGEDFAQNYSEAIKWFTKAAEQGHVLAAATLGAFYWAGRGVKQDYVAAYMWSTIAESAGDEASKYRVAILRSRMNSAELSQAQREATAWLDKHADPLTAKPSAFRLARP